MNVARPRVLLGLIGAGIQQSLSPALHEAEGDAHGLRIQYRVLDLDVLALGETALPRLLEATRLAGFAGVNVTFPCKQTVLPLLDALSDDARAMNAVNTVVFRDGLATGHNTDASGFAAGLRRGSLRPFHCAWPASHMAAMRCSTSCPIGTIRPIGTPRSVITTDSPLRVRRR